MRSISKGDPFPSLTTRRHSDDTLTDPRYTAGYYDYARDTLVCYATKGPSRVEALVLPLLQVFKCEGISRI